ncbi:MAG: hypothetical protein A2741_00140 [Candidatus Zambryskibacteria bacterium RIFCSPHIGHO2_01_FULL_43_27]|nr:MAG: hypothetical protein A2741_00140 [Candidatus Zambryskibacteria bacterium RIFCSPHIGHO2_01_FULL_43_27]OHA99495.1 MAG: hypothetical protein A3E93_02865 [Candidatus Zambryskibacteria bacterium RIFCSPHIGHO2_12_FULL_43_12b]
MENSNFQLKSFWERPEGTAGMIFLTLLLGIPVVMFWGAILPWVVQMLQNTLTAIFLATGVAGLLYIGFNRRFRTLVSYLFKSAMRAVTGIFIEIDPIGIMKSYISEGSDKLEKIREQKSSLAGGLRSLDDEMSRNTQDITQSLAEAKAAREAVGKKITAEDAERVISLAARQIDRLESMNTELKPLRDNMEALLRVTADMERQAEFVLNDLAQEVKVEERKRKAMTSGKSALRAAQSILQGNDAAKELYDEALEATRDRYARAMGEIDLFVDETRDIATMVNLRDAVAVEKVNARIDAMLSSMETKVDTAIMPKGSEMKQIKAASADPRQALDLSRLDAIPVSQEKRGGREKYGRVFDDTDK